jgi:hypothetical protein
MPPLGARDPDGDGSLPLLVENDQAIADAASPFGVNWSCRRFSILCLRPSLPAWGVFFVYSEKARRLRSARDGFGGVQRLGLPARAAANAYVARG